MPTGALPVQTIAGRECDGCTVCCSVKAVASDTFVKGPGVRCEHCLDDGCGIYFERPAVCAGYQCGWRFLPWLPDRLKPDVAGIIVDPMPPPSGYALAVSISAVKDTAAFQNDDVRGLVSELIGKGVAVYLSLSKGANILNVFLLANPVLHTAVEGQDSLLLANELQRLGLQLDAEAGEPFRPER